MSKADTARAMARALPNRSLLSLAEIAAAWGVSVVKARHILRDILGLRPYESDEN